MKVIGKKIEDLLLDQVLSLYKSGRTRMYRLVSVWSVSQGNISITAELCIGTNIGRKKPFTFPILIRVKLWQSHGS